jgi:hypothetical protein
MKSLLLITKLSLFIILFSLTIVIAFVSLFLLSNLPQSYAKEWLESYLRNTFSLNFTVQSLRGNLLESITIENLKIKDSLDDDAYEILTIQEATLSYNLAKFIFIKDKLQAINDININGANVYIIRDPQGKWRNLRLTKPKTNQSHVSGDIYVNDVSLHYQDYLGWKKKPLLLPFQTTVKQLTGSLRFDNPSKGTLNLKGVLAETQQPFAIEGFVVPNDNNYFIKFNTPEVSLNKWLSYTLPMDGFTAFDGLTNISGFITKKKYSTKNPLPFWYDITFEINNGSIITPYIDAKISSANGNIAISQGIINNSFFQSLKPEITADEARKIIASFKKNELINATNDLSKKALSGIKTRQFHSNKKIQNHLESHIKNPKFLLTFQDVVGTFADIPTTFNGTLNLKDRWLELLAESDDAETSIAQTLFPDLEVLELQNPAKVSLAITGDYRNPVLDGIVISDQIRCFDYNVENVDATFKFYNNKFDFKLNKGMLWNSLLAGDVGVNIGKASSSIDAMFYLSNFNFSEDISQKIISGNMDISVNFSGTKNELQGNVDILSEDLTFLNQSLNLFKGSLSIYPESIQITSGNLFINNILTPMEASITIADELLSIDLSATDIVWFDPIIKASQNTGFLSLDSVLYYPIKNKQAQLFPAKGFLDISIDQPYINNQRYEHLNSKIIFENYNAVIKNANITSGNSKISIVGTIEEDLTSTLNISINDIDTGLLAIKSAVLPKEWTPLSVIFDDVSTKLNYSPKFGLTGEASLKLDSLQFNSLMLDTVTSKISFQDKKIEFNSIEITKDKSKLLLTGVSDSSNTTFEIIPSSSINLENLDSYLNISKDWKGSVLLDGDISYNPDSYTILTRLRAPRLEINTISLQNTLANVKITPEKILINDFSTSLGDGKVRLDWQLNHNRFKEISIFGKTSFKSVPIIQLEKIVNSLNTIEISEIINDTVPSTVLNITSPFNQDQSILIQSPSSEDVEYDFIQSLKSSATKSFRNKEFTLFQGGLLSGEVKMKKNPNNFPLFDGMLEINALAGTHVSGQEMELLFKDKTQTTAFEVIITNGLANQNFFDSISIAGSITPTYEVSINKSNFNASSYVIDNPITGMVQLPNSESLPPHNIDMTLNLSNDNFTIVPMLFSSITNINYQGELLLNVSGSLEAPLINTLINSDQKLSVTTDQNNYQINATAFNIKDNQLTFPELSIKSQPIIENSTQKAVTLNFHGQVFLEELNLKQIDSVITSVNIGMSDQDFKLNNPLIRGEISMKDTTLKGPIIMSLDNITASEKYQEKSLSLPLLKANINLKNSELLIPRSQKSLDIPVILDLDIDIADNVIFSGPVFGNNFFGISADLEFNQTESPMYIRGPLDRMEISNQVTVSEGSLTILNRNFNILSPTQQQIYANSGSILLNEITMTNLPNDDGASTIIPLLSLKALYIRENDISTQNQRLPYTHIVMSIDDNATMIGNISFDIFDSITEYPNNISELTFIKTYVLNNETLADTDAVAQSEITELLEELIPEIYLDSSAEGFQTIGETQINTIIRRSILRPLEKNIAKQIGLNDLKINYNLGEKIISGTDGTLGLEFIKNILSDRLVLNLSTLMDLSEESRSTQANNMHLSEIKLSYYFLKNKNLSLNYITYKNELDENNNYLQKFSMRYDYDY